MPSTLIVHACSNASFHCEITGRPPPLISWYWNGLFIDCSGKKQCLVRTNVAGVSFSKDNCAFCNCAVRWCLLASNDACVSSKAISYVKVEDGWLFVQIRSVEGKLFRKRPQTSFLRNRRPKEFWKKLMQVIAEDYCHYRTLPLHWINKGKTCHAKLPSYYLILIKVSKRLGRPDEMAWQARFGPRAVVCQPLV